MRAAAPDRRPSGNRNAGRGSVRRGWLALARVCALVLIEAVAATGAFVLVIGGVLLWRVSQGPITIEGLGPIIRAELERQGEDQGLKVTAGDIRLVWGGPAQPLRVQVQRIEASAENEAVRTVDRFVTVPELDVGFDVQALMAGAISPTDLELVRPVLRLTRLENGDLVLSIRPTPGTGDHSAAFGETLMRALFGPPDPNAPFQTLSHLTVRDARLILDDLRTGFVWDASRANITVTRTDAAVRLDATVDISLGAGATSLSVMAQLDRSNGRTRVSVRSAVTALSDLVAAVPELQAIGRLGWSVAGQLEFELNADHSLESARASIQRLEGSGDLAVVVGSVDDSGRRMIELWVNDVNLVDLSPLAPNTALLSGLHVAVDGTLRMALNADGQIESGQLSVRGTDGRISLPHLALPQVPIDSFLLDATVDVRRRLLELRQLQVDLGGPRLVADGWATQVVGSDRIDWLLDASLTALPVARLAEIWPNTVAPKPRSWILKNIKDGQADRTQVLGAGSVSIGDSPAFRLDRLAGSVGFSGVSVQYFRPLEPAQGVGGVLNIGLDDIEIAIDPGARVRDVAITGGLVRLTDLRTDDEMADISIGIAGPLRTVLEVIDSNPLNLARKLDIAPRNVGGQVAGTLGFRFPLIDALQVEDLDINVTGRTSAAAIREVAPDIDLSGGRFDIAVTQDRLDLKGSGLLNRVPVEATLVERFEGPQPRTRLDMVATLDRTAMRRLDIPLPDDVIDGPVPTRATLVSIGPKRFRLTARHDLTRAEVRLDPLGWHKPPGGQASAETELTIVDDRLTGLALRRIVGPGLTAEAALAFRRQGADDIVVRVDVPVLRIGRTDLSGEATRDLQTGRWRVRATGPALDLEPILARETDTPRDAADASAPAPETIVELGFEIGRVRIDEGMGLASVVGTAQLADDRLRRADLAASAGQSRVLFRYGPGPGDRPGLARFRLETQDLGLALHGLGIDDRFRGGRAVVIGRHRDDGSPEIDGRLEIESLHAVGAPVLARLLNALSLTGLSDLLSTDGISFDRVEGDLSYQEGVLTVARGRAVGGSIGMTADGRIRIFGADSGTSPEIALSGTVVPLYGLNQVIGAIPLLGDIITGGEGQGLFAATWRMTGPNDDPNLSVNPLSLLAPGIIRRLLFSNDAAQVAEDPPDR